MSWEACNGSIYFMPTCPQPECAVKNHHDSKFCSECGARLYPTQAQIEGARRENAK